MADSQPIVFTDPEATTWPLPSLPVEGPDDGLWRRAEALLVRGVLGVLGALPDGPRSGLLGLLARVGRRLDRRHAKAARAFLAQALPERSAEEREELVLQAYRHFLRVVLDAHRWERAVRGRAFEDVFDVRMTPDVREALERSGGRVLVTAHLGNWEALPSVCAHCGFHPTYAVAKPMKSRPLSRATQRSRERRGFRLLPRRGAMAEAPKVFGAGGSLGLLLDQRARVKPVLAPFFGRPARCDRSAGVLLRRSRVPVIVGFCVYTDPRKLSFRVEFPLVLWPEELRGASPEEIAGRINAAFEEAIRRHPEQYFWLHDRYRDTPEAFEPSVEQASSSEP